MRRTNVLALVFSVLALAAAVWVVWIQTATTTDKEAVQQQAESLADQVAEACAKGGPAATELGGACQKAAEVQSSADPATPAPVADPAQIREAARSAVLDFCGQPSQPCRGKEGASPDVDAIVAQVVAKIPLPKDGTNGQDAPAVTGDEVFAAVTQYCAQSDEPCRGSPGSPGANGETPPCMAEATQCQGDTGADGRGVVSHSYLLVDGQCVERTYYTRDPSPVDVPVGAALCESSTPTTEPPTETP